MLHVLSDSDVIHAVTPVTQLRFHLTVCFPSLLLHGESNETGQRKTRPQTRSNAPNHAVHVVTCQSAQPMYSPLFRSECTRFVASGTDHTQPYPTAPAVDDPAHIHHTAFSDGMRDPL